MGSLLDEYTAEAYSYAERYGISSSGAHNGPLDAFRHAYASAAMAQDYGSATANIFGNANEINGDFLHDQPASEKNMDLYNNKVGRDISVGTESRDQIAEKVYSALIAGTLITDPNLPGNPMYISDYDRLVEVVQHFPVGTVSSARRLGVEGLIPAGYETNALDVISDTNFRYHVQVVAPAPNPEYWREAWADHNLAGGYSTDPSRPGALHGDPLRGLGILVTTDRDPTPTHREMIEQIKDNDQGSTGGSDRPDSAQDRATSVASSGGTGHQGSGNNAPSGGRPTTAPHTPGGNPRPGDQHPPSSPTSAGNSTEVKHGAGRPILLDLDGDGVQITELSRSTKFIDGGEGLLHKTAWAAAGNGVLFFDPDGRNTITEKRQYVFTDWNPTASGDLEALRSVWDSNGDGKLTAADTDFAKFKVMVTNANGTTTVQTLTQLGITEINLTADTTHITLPDGSLITGQTTFTRSNGTTGTVANTTLISEAQGHRVVQSTTGDGAGNQTKISTAYDTAGAVVYVITSLSNATGTAFTNSYDGTGDGVVDRIQTITKVTNGNGSKTETLINKAGADAGTAILVDRTVTTTSADNKIVTIERDGDGGGWFDQREVRTTNADGSRTVVISDLAQSGAVIRSSSETVTINGLSRSEGVDEDGNGTAETTTAHVITIAGNNSRTEVTSQTNGNGSLRASETETISADGKTRSLTFDLDGDGDTDRAESHVIVGSAGTTKTTTTTIRNGDNSLRNATTLVLSADTLVKTQTSDVDGNGVIDLTSVETTTLNGNNSRQTTLLLTNTDGSVRGNQKITLGADKVTSETWIDQKQDGVLQLTDLVKSVVVDATSQARTATLWDRNADGSAQSKVVSVTSADGLSVATTIDADGDIDTDTSISDVTVFSAGIGTQTVITSNQDASLRTKVVTTTSANGLTVTREADIDGNGSYDGKTVDARVLGGDGSVTRTVSDYAGNGTTLMARSITTESADRRDKTVTVDANGDGFTDSRLSSSEAADGSRIVTQTGYFANVAVANKSVSAISANGLIASNSIDRNGDLLFETVQMDTTTLNADGSRTRSVDINNGDGSNRSLFVTTVSDDGLAVTTQSDGDGDGVFERVSTGTSVLNANGSVTRTDQMRAANTSLLSQSEMIVSDDRLVTTIRSDADGDGDFDLSSTQTTQLLNNGGTTMTTELRTAANVLRSKTTTTTSDDGRSVIQSTDVNGDGQSDTVSSRIVADNGTTTQTGSEQGATGALQSRTLFTTSDDGLTSSTKWDRNGDGSYERQTDDTSVLNADGSVSRTMTGKSSNGTSYSQSVIVNSDDGLTTTRSDDINGDGTADLTTTSSSSRAATGVATQSVVHKAANNTTIDSKTVITSADGRAVTESFDADGNGINDRVTTTTVGNAGVVTSSSNFYSTGGGLEASYVATVSGDGLTRITALDRNGDGRVEILTTAVTEFGEDGTVSQRIEYRNDRNVLLALQESFSSDDGLLSTSHIDANGDEVFELQTEDVTTYQTDGDVLRVQITRDGTSDMLSTVTRLTSGNGLVSSVTADYSGDGSIDRTRVTTTLADGASSEASNHYGAGYDLQMATSETISADGRNRSTAIDLDGDGLIDREVVALTDLSRNQTTTFRDLQQNGDVDQQVTGTATANGMQSSYAFDLDGDGIVDVIRTRSVSFAAEGSEIVTSSEIYGADTLGFEKITTNSANGLSSTSIMDIDGDGTADGTSTRQTILNADGSKQVITTTLYADGALRSKFEQSISADGRTITERMDYDGNGIADKTVETRIGADGARVEVETAYDKGGMRGQIFTTTTSVDGLDTSIIRTGNQQTITRSVIDNGSYVWNNGVTAAIGATNIVVSHAADALGIDTWTQTNTWKYNYFNGTTTEVRDGISTVSVRLDGEAASRLMTEAARIYDTVLDRGLDFTEREQLVTFVTDGQLDKSALVTSLLGSGEFATRYGTLNNAEFATQIYLNTVGRAPTLAEADLVIRNLYGTTPAMTRAQIALEVSDSIEHLLVGNGHLATNNFDVILNPAVFERSLDLAYTRSIVENLVDTVYDRDATEQELDYLSDRLMRDVDNPDEIAALLRGLSGDIQGVSSKSLNGLSGAPLVEQAFLNALGRQPTAQEQLKWETNLSSGYITNDQFIATLAMSVEKITAGDSHLINSLPTITTLNGTAVANTLTGTAAQNILNGLAGNDLLKEATGTLLNASGVFDPWDSYGQGTVHGSADRLTGGTGNDSLIGGRGSDAYVWAKGDGNDIVYDLGTSILETDTLELTDVVSTDVELIRIHNTDDLSLRIRSTNETITISRQMLDITKGYGLEAITFSDGVTWSLDQIIANTRFTGTIAAENGGRQNYTENLYGDDGNDTLTGSAGDDRLVGGLGVDSLLGAGGNDTYVWSRGHGADIINDDRISTTAVDRLFLTEVVQSDIQLLRLSGADDLIIRIGGSGGADILVKNRFNVTPADPLSGRTTEILNGYGIEIIEFSDGSTWELSDIFRQTVRLGDQASNNMTGTSFDDFIQSLDGADTVTGGNGNDTLEGGLGADSLVGGNGDDTYKWAKNDGNDTINDNDTTTFESDVLVLADVASNDVLLSRTSGSLHLNIRIVSTGEVLTISNKYNSASNGNYGIESIRFSDGVEWDLKDIRTRTKVEGSSGAEKLDGTSFIDNLYGFGGIDTLTGGLNDDLLIGGTGADVLDGGGGNDRFEWSLNEGNDSLSDTASSIAEVDTLALKNVASTAAILTKSGTNLVVTMSATGEAITVNNRFNAAGDGFGVEMITFSDGVTTEILASPVAEIITTGTSAAQTMTGWNFKDTQFGNAGADTLDTKNGDDRLVGGDGNDTLKGGNGSDQYERVLGDDNDLIDDAGQSVTEIDTLLLSDVTASQVALKRTTGSSDLVITLLTTNETITVKNRFSATATPIGYGIEQIIFADGATWSLDDIFAETRLAGR